MLFLLSFRQRDELQSLFARAGWRVVAARRADGARTRFAASGAAVAIVDARGALDDGLAATADLSSAVTGAGGVLLAMVSKGDAGRLDAFFEAGAAQFVVSPVGEGELVQAARFALRQAERHGAEWRQGPGGGEALGWRYDPVRRSLQVTPALASVLALPDGAGPRALLQRLPADARRSALAAVRRLGTGQAATAFAQALPPVGRVVAHLQRDEHTRRLHGLIEPLGGVPDAGAVVGDALAGTRDPLGAQRWIAHRLDGGEPVVALLAVLGGVDPVNRADGREAGDRLLRAAGRRIEAAARDALGRRGALARLGGNSFLLATRSGDADRLHAAADAVEAAVARPFVAGDRMVTLSLRIGRGEAVPGDDAEALFRRLREAVPGARADDASAAPLAADVAQAIARDELRVLFQPQVELSTGRIVGVEALARWQHGLRGPIGPEALFDAADKAGVAVAVSAHVQALALRGAAAWPRSLGTLRLSINVTATDVAQPDFADRLLGRIDDSGFARDRLTVEITETGLIDDLGEAAGLLATLRSAGCRVAIDDFGTGYSSLAYLKSLPLDYLKIDKRLSHDITGSPRDRVVVRGVIDMAHSLGLSVVAEGIETEAQLDALAAEGCRYYQGFLCSGAVDTAELTRLVG